MKEPLVSILMPAFNAEECVAESIQSALAQSWRRKELIIVDDGSTDRTLECARRFEGPQVKVLSRSNRGAAAARNVALWQAQGDYLQWLDADDLLAPDKIERQMHRADDSQELLTSSFASFIERTSKARFQPNPLWKDLTPRDWLLAKFERNGWLNPAVWLVSRQLSDQAGGWNEELTLDDDGEYFARLVAGSRAVRYVGEARSYYRHWNPGSLSRQVSEAACRSLLTSLKLCISYLLGLEDSLRTRAASVVYLQSWYHYFYPDKTELMSEAQQEAKRLGGHLHEPYLNRKYRPIRALLGWQAAKRAMNLVAGSKLRAARRWERLMSGNIPPGRSDAEDAG